MKEVKLTGSCLCNKVQYSISGQAVRFYHCHCKRCRKVTGTGHASNLLVTPLVSLQWTQGKSETINFKLPDTERFYTCFCRHCGSQLPRTVPELDGILIPAGTLDQEPPIQPSARIYWGSRAKWSCESGDLPTYETMP